MKKSILICACIALLGCGPTDAERNAIYMAEDLAREKEKLAEEKAVDHEEIIIDESGKVVFELGKCKIKFPEEMTYEGKLKVKKADKKTTIEFNSNDSGTFILETINKKPRSGLLRYFNGALVGMDLNYGYTGNDSAVKDTLDGVYRVTYKTLGYSGQKNHGVHRLFYKNGVVYALYCIKKGSYVADDLTNSFLESFEFILTAEELRQMEMDSLMTDSLVKTL